jgi:hypothetical protein
MKPIAYTLVACVVALFAVGVILLILSLIAVCAHADNRPLFDIEYGESNDELWAFGRGWDSEYHEGTVWQDFDELDRDVYVVIATPYWWEDESEKCVLVRVKNHGWRGRYKNPATLNLKKDGVFELVQLRTRLR